MKFQAAIHGIDLDKDKKEKVMFPHPDTFKDLSDEEKKKKTEQQMMMHKMMLPKNTRL